MSKKKSFSGSTMTLKDFHGGSIPSDIPLPSAPGVIVRPSDRATFDRQGSFGNPLGRGDHRLRPSSSGSIRSLDDKTPFLSNSAHIGRNFDEDERKPLDGVSGPRRTISDECIAPPPIRVEPRSDVGRFSGQQGSSPLSQVHTPAGGPYAARVAEGLHTGAPSWNSSSGGQGVIGGGSHPNAWAARKEVVGVAETPSPYSGQSSVSKFAQASALDKVSSGRWQTKPVHHQADVEVIRQVESPKNMNWRSGDAYHGTNSINEREYNERVLVRRVERGLNVEESAQNVGKEAPGMERIRSAALVDAKERNPGLLTVGGQPLNHDGKHGIPGSQNLAEAPERPKLKLLPRSKPLEAPEAPLSEDKLKFLQPYDSSHMETGIEVLGTATHVKPVLSASDEEEENQLVERPKLKLKPRSQPLDQANASTEGVRKAVFGGARPRELVLKERGVDDVVHAQEVVHSPVRVKNDTPRPETAPAHSNATRRNDKAENVNLNHRTGKINDRRERVDAEKVETQKKNWRNEKWRHGREAEKQPHLQSQQERPPSPETWRRPVEEPKSANTDSSGRRYSKTASAAELAQAFSRSVSDPKMNPDQFPGGKGVPGRNQVPFSRLTGPTTRPQINGY